MKTGETSESSPAADDFAWVEVLLETPVPDGRHRIIGTVLAPYLVTVKGVGVEDAEKIIEGWVEKCESYEPVKGNIRAFVKRTCLEAHRLKKKPKDLGYIKTKLNNLYREIVEMAGYRGIKIK